MPNNPGDLTRHNYGSQKSQTGGSQKDKADFGGQRDQQKSNGRSASTSDGGDVNLRLTPEQQAQIRQATGKNLQSLSLSVEDIAEGSSTSPGSSESSEDERGMEDEE